MVVGNNFLWAWWLWKERTVDWMAESLVWDVEKRDNRTCATIALCWDTTNDFYCEMQGDARIVLYYLKMLAIPVSPSQPVKYCWMCICGRVFYVTVWHIQYNVQLKRLEPGKYKDICRDATNLNVDSNFAPQFFITLCSWRHLNVSGNFVKLFVEKFPLKIQIILI